jgi:diaminobutyrate-2-oxoglutarate transaminase
MNQFERLESNVRSYCRSFSDTFSKAKNAYLYADNGTEYIDFFAGAGALNYGHNNDYIKQSLLDYLASDQVIHSLDMYTSAKATFIQRFSELVLEPKRYPYKMQFCGPTGTNAVEAALKLARKVKNRTGIFSFMGGFHGMSQGSLAVTGNKFHRMGAGLPLNNTTFMPFPHGFMNSFDTIDYVDSVLTDPNSGIEKPAAMIVETIQAEGGVIVAPVKWLQRLSELCQRHDILLIVDDIQVGCGRTGPFFSFERAGIVPDMVVLSKSISGYGLPMSLLLLKPELDIWKPGEHNGTFRGNQLAFVGATAALEFKETEHLEAKVLKKESYIQHLLYHDIQKLHPDLEIRGLGMIWGIDFSRFPKSEEVSAKIARRCYDSGLIIERSGRNDTVLKILPPLTIEMDVLQKGCEIVMESIQHFLQGEILGEVLNTNREIASS